MSAAALVLAPVFLPLAVGALSAVLPRRAAATLTVIAAAATLMVAVLLGIAVLDAGPVRLEVAGWAPPVGILLAADGLSVVMIGLSAIAVLAAALVAAADDHFAGGPAFWPLVGAAAAAVNGVFVARDVFTAFVLLELLTIASVALVALGGARSAAAALRYLFVAVTGSLFFLLAVALTYGHTGTVDLARAAERADDTVIVGAIIALTVVGMAAKTALFPLHSWLPVAHPAAPTAVSALLSALVIKASIVILWRIVEYFGPLTDLAAPLATAVGVAGAAAVLWGGVLALRRDRLKSIIAYSTVAQVGYMVLLVPLVFTASDPQVAWIGGILITLAHGVAKAAMFLAAGALAAAAGTGRLDGLEGTISRMPWTVAAIGLAGVSLAGLPPTLGFVGKWMLVQASLDAGAWWWLALLLGGGLLTFAYTARMLRATFNPPGDFSGARELTRPARTVAVVPLALAALSVVLGLIPWLLIDVLSAAPMGGGA